MRISKGFVGVLCIVVMAGLVYAGHISGDAAFTKLLEGNKRFTEGKPAVKECGAERREELTKGQHPFATVLSCSDSRVPPEVVFDQALGDIFIIRVAGNVIEPTILGSIEYGVEHLHTPLLIILGHEQCGAVKAALETQGEAEGNIGVILRKIKPAVESARKADMGKEETLDLAVRENVKNTYNEIMKSPIVSHLSHEGKLKIVAAEYRLKSGMIETIELGTAPAGHAHH